MKPRRLALLLAAALAALFAIGAYRGRHRGLADGETCTVCGRRK